MGKVEEDGFDVNGFWARRGHEGRVPGPGRQRPAHLPAVPHRGHAGHPVRGVDPVPVQRRLGRGAGRPHRGRHVAAILAVRQDISYKILTEAVISDAAGKVILNLAQQDAVAMRAVMRVAFQVANPISLQAPTEATRFPFAVLARRPPDRWASLTVAELREHGDVAPGHRPRAHPRVLRAGHRPVGGAALRRRGRRIWRSPSRLGARADAPAPAPGADRGVVRGGHPPGHRDRARPDGYRVEERYLRRSAMAPWGEWTRVTYTPLDDSRGPLHRACPAGPAGAERPAGHGCAGCRSVVRDLRQVPPAAQRAAARDPSRGPARAALGPTPRRSAADALPHPRRHPGARRGPRPRRWRQPRLRDIEDLASVAATWCRRSRSPDLDLVTVEDRYEIVLAGHHPEVRPAMVVLDGLAVYDIVRVAPTLGRRETVLVAQRVAI